MIFDSYGCLRMEQCAFPGSVGDSCAETSRLAILTAYLDKDTSHRGVLLNFFSQFGVLRHPDSPWRENDTSGDQVMPLLIALHVSGLYANAEALMQPRTGNGDLVSPLLYATQKRFSGKASWFWDLAALGQALISKLPFRWSDDKRRFTQSSDSSCDYLNLLMYIIYAKMVSGETWPVKLARYLVGYSIFAEKISKYYAPEPNPFVVLYYIRALDEIYRRK